MKTTPAVFVGGHRDGETHDDWTALPPSISVLTEEASARLRDGQRVDLPVPTVRYYRTGSRDRDGRVIYRLLEEL